MIHFLRLAWSQYKNLIVLFALLLLSFLMMRISDHTAMKSLRTVVFGTFASVSSVFSGVFSISDIQNENERLRERVAELMLDVSLLKEQGDQADELKQMLKVRDSLSYQLITAKIISKAVNAGQANFTLNRGKNHGIEEGMPVINGDGLVGIVFEVSGEYSVIRTLKNYNLKIVVKNIRSNEQGILKWTGEHLTMANLPKTADIKIGDEIHSSELSSLLTIPIRIGFVEEVLNPDKGVFTDLKIRPAVDFGNAEYVFAVSVVAGQKKEDHPIPNYFELR